MDETKDFLSQIIDVLPGSPVASLRAQRPDFVQYTQGSYEKLITPDQPAGLSHAERAAVAQRVAALSGHPALARHYAELPAAYPADDPADVRRRALLRHAELVTLSPGRATQADIAALQQAGLTAHEIVTLSQIIAFVSYQSRIAAGLALLAAEAKP